MRDKLKHEIEPKTSEMELKSRFKIKMNRNLKYVFNFKRNGFPSADSFSCMIESFERGKINIINYNKQHVAQLVVFS